MKFSFIPPLRLLFSALFLFLIWSWAAPPASAFCGFYVAKADTKLYNQASQVILARNGDRTILTMANDYQGDVKDFALVVPVPTLLKQEQVRVANPNIVERLDGFSAPRLVEYFDPDPCSPVLYRQSAPAPRAAGRSEAAGIRGNATDAALGVTIEAKFTVGEYDILILSAKESDGLETWLNRNNYKIPRGASSLLKPYIRQKMKFFVAKVNLGEYQKTGFQSLRPLQMAYESSKFMLPIRLGMINARNEQDLVVYLLSPQGQVQLTNYRTVKVPSDAEIPVFVKNQFSDFYKSMFKKAYEYQDRKVAFLEYAWDMGNCDPCSADPLSREELKQAGVFWLDAPVPMPRNGSRPAPPIWGGSNVFITRLHVRYTRDKFPEDLVFQETSDRSNFQGRYILRHPFKGDLNCPAGREYRQQLSQRLEREAQTLAKLTGWQIQDIRKKLNVVGTEPGTTDGWWRSIWP